MLPSYNSKTLRMSLQFSFCKLPFKTVKYVCLYTKQQNMLTFLSIPCIPFSFSFQIQHSWTVWNTKKIYQKFEKKKCPLLEFTCRYITKNKYIYICTAKVCPWYTAKYIWFTSKLNDFPIYWWTYIYFILNNLFLKPGIICLQFHM